MKKVLLVVTIDAKSVYTIVQELEKMVSERQVLIVTMNIQMYVEISKG